MGVQSLAGKTPPNLELQIKVSKILSRGFVFSIFCIGGIGSLIAFISGLKARNLIRQSEGELAGIRMAWWCIVVGALGMIFGPIAVISVVINQGQ
jgi:hypothetical protein